MLWAGYNCFMLINKILDVNVDDRDVQTEKVCNMVYDVIERCQYRPVIALYQCKVMFMISF